MSTTWTDRSPRLVVVTPGNDSGRQIELAAPELVVGRSPECDVRFEDPHVSRRHAALVRRAGSVYVQDLGSTSGTYVNGIRVAGPHVLWPGDIVAFAGIEARLDPALDDPAAFGPPAAPSQVRYDVGSQHAGVLNNVGRDQYNSYVQHVTRQRESFLREVAGTRTKARWLVWLGLVCMVVGMVLFASGPLSFLQSVDDAARHGTQPTGTPFGPQVIVGWLLGFSGSVLLVIGIVLHVVATSRRNRVDRTYPVPVAAGWA